MTRAVSHGLGRVEGVEDIGYYDELDLPSESRAVIEEALEGLRIVAYHATRLMDHEVKAVLNAGLRPLSAQLMDDKVQDAVRHG